MTWDDAGMQGNARPGDALHEGHRCAAIDVGTMKFLFLDDAENAHRRWMIGHAGRNRTLGKQAIGVVKAQLLLRDGDRNDERALRFGRLLFGNARPGIMMAARFRLARQYRRYGLSNAGSGILPIVDRGFRSRDDNERSDRRQKSNPPKAFASKTNRLPAHPYAFHFQT